MPKWRKNSPKLLKEAWFGRVWLCETSRLPWPCVSFLQVVDAALFSSQDNGGWLLKGMVMLDGSRRRWWFKTSGSSHLFGNIKLNSKLVSGVDSRTRMPVHCNLWRKNKLIILYFGRPIKVFSHSQYRKMWRIKRTVLWVMVGGLPQPDGFWKLVWSCFKGLEQGIEKKTSNG